MILEGHTALRTGLGSPDVAFTEAVIGTISTIFFVASLKKIDRWCK